MSKAKTPGESSVFDIEQVREIVEMMIQHELSEVDLRQDDRRIRLRRGGNSPAVIGYAPPASVAAATPAAPPSAPPSAPAASVAANEGAFEYITSPTVGTFYSRPKPGAPDFVNIGDSVDPGTIVCLVEAMKMFNEIPAGVSGKIVACLVKNEDPVDVGKPLFKIAPH
jgi:acetyl-CoA carboxylase biotin carboxyl carrier protein